MENPLFNDSLWSLISSPEMLTDGMVASPILFEQVTCTGPGLGAPTKAPSDMRDDCEPELSL